MRWYLPKGKGRVGFREGRASLVKKGKKVLIDGILKRSEEKSQGLSMWQMTQDLQGHSESLKQLKARWIKLSVYRAVQRSKANSRFTTDAKG